MHRRQLFTAAIGVLGVLFALTAFLSDLWADARILCVIAGICLFLWAASNLYSEWKEESSFGGAGISLPVLQHRNSITQIDLINDEDKVIASWELFQKTSAVIGKDFRENQVDIDLGRSEYATLVDIHHAVLNYAEGSWYVEDLGSKNGVTVQKVLDGRKYKLSSDQPCKLQRGDILLIGLCRLKLH